MHALPPGLGSPRHVSIRARLGGRAMLERVRARYSVDDVSIRARLGGRAMPANSSLKTKAWMFQSAPGWVAGRCGPALSPAALAAQGFNPRPAGWPGDAPPAASAHPTPREFQSAPGWVAGRCNTAPLKSAFEDGFQSAPGWVAGRCHRWPCQPGRLSKFQSAPGWVAGRCSVYGATQRPALVVSIRARLGGRAMPNLGGEFLEQLDVSIRARLGGRAMRPEVQRPALYATGFNPRPAGWPGDAEVSTSERPPFHVSIRARLGGRAMPDQCGVSRGGHDVSIRARLGGRAMRRYSRRTSCHTPCFNPRPAGWPGDAQFAPELVGLCLVFQSAPGWVAGRCVKVDRK